MSIVIYILTMVFALYAIYSVISSKDKPTNTDTPTSSPKVAVESEETVSEITTVEDNNSEVIASTKAATTETDEDNSLRNPLTGEIAKIPNNYRFSKRWIKEALVAEELLDKIYKNSELNDEINTKIKAALETLKTMQKYHV